MIKYGRWWDNKKEIDIVGIDSSGKNIIFGECKYHLNKKMDVDVFYNLKEKSKLVDWRKEERKESYILFSISGYTKELIELAKERDNLILA